MWEYNAEVLRVIDGDTLDLAIDLGFRTFSKVRVRLYGIDTPETYGVPRESEEWQAGMAAKAFVLEWLDNHDGNSVRIRSHDGGTPRAGKYGRWLVEVWPRKRASDTESLNKALIVSGNAKPYE